MPGTVLGDWNREVEHILCPQESQLCKACKPPPPHFIFSVNIVFEIHLLIRIAHRG